MAEKVDSDDESEGYSDDYSDQGGSVSRYGDYHYGHMGQPPVDYHKLLACLQWVFSAILCNYVSYTILPPKEPSGCTGIIVV